MRNALDGCNGSVENCCLLSGANKLSLLELVLVGVFTVIVHYSNNL